MDHYFEYDPDMMMRVDTNGNIIEANRRAREFYASQHKTLQGRNICSLNGESGDEITALLKKARSQNFARMDIRVADEQGKIVPVELSIWKSPSEDMGLLMLRIRDVSETRDLHKKVRWLKHQNSVFIDIFMHMPDGAIIVNCDGEIRETNHAAEDLLGKKSGDIAGKEISSVLGNPIPHTRKMLITGESYNDVELIIEKNIHAVISGIPYRDQKGNISGGVLFLRPIQKVHLLVNRFSGAQARYSFDDIVAKSRSMQESIEMAIRAAHSMSNVLLEGESGTGKEVFAQAIHNEGIRQNGPFVAINCGALPHELIGSELFGYVEGAFTGARKGGSPGKFELAAGGTLFLDEIADMPLEQQVTLLRVLQEKSVTRIGDSRVIPVDVRVICATNKDLWREVEAGNFRVDLYYRLNVISIEIAPLRERVEDIMPLFDYFLDKISKKQGLTYAYNQKELEKYLKNYSWPGNVRELQNVVERMAHVASGDALLTSRHLPPGITFTGSQANTRIQNSPKSEKSLYEERSHRRKIREEEERREILELLERYQGNISRIAKEMGVNRSTIYRKMHQYKISE